VGASRNSYKPLYFYTRIKIYSFYTSFIRVCLPKLGTRLYLHKHLYKYKLEKKSHFFVCDIRALGNQPTLVQTRQRVKYLCLFVLLVHASNSVRNRTKLHRCALLSPHESPWAKLFHFGDASLESHFFACDIRALGNQPMLVQTWQRVKYLCLFVLLVHASNSVRNRTKLHRCALLSPHESPWAKL
jgi:hypothetical protein